MKGLNIKEIFITITVGVLVCAYIQAEINPLKWAMGARFMNVCLVGLSLIVRIISKNS